MKNFEKFSESSQRAGLGDNDGITVADMGVASLMCHVWARGAERGRPGRRERSREDDPQSRAAARSHVQRRPVFHVTPPASRDHVALAGLCWWKLSNSVYTV